MARKHIKTLFILVAVSTTSCVRESLPECPFQSNTTVVFVKDKNYANTGMDGVDPVSEELPFKAYVSTTYYTLQHTKTDENMFDPVITTITGDEKEIGLSINPVPDGEYRLTVWGNSGEYSSSTDSYILHNNNQEGTDVYKASNLITIAASTSDTQRLGLERTKGRLLVAFNNLPESVVRIDKNVTSIYQNVTSRGIYSGNTYVAKTFLKETQSLNRISTCLAPTIEGDKSVLSLSFYTSSSDVPVAEIPAIEVIIKRNETTVIAINYNAPQRQVEVWDFIDGEWTLIIKLDI